MLRISKKDKDILENVRKAVESSPTLRSKKVLIEEFIKKISNSVIDDFMGLWENFILEKRNEELDLIISEENLKPLETKKFLDNAFDDGEVKTYGTNIDKILPAISRFGSNKRSEMKERVIAKLKHFFEKFYGMGISKSFLDSEKEDDNTDINTY